jgi:hypothetical protein
MLRYVSERISFIMVRSQYYSKSLVHNVLAIGEGGSQILQKIHFISVLETNSL